MRPLYAPLAGATPTPRAAPRPLPARRLSSPARMAGFSFVDALKGTFEKLTDFRVARASHILLKSFDQEALDRMRQWKAQIADDPVAFAEVARNFSQCPSRIKGGELGFFTRGKMVKEFDAVVFSEEPGYVYGPVRTDFGNHLIFIHSCREPRDAM
mmetsp:Transcript_2916/g.4458  ORF Transcript_2916/g.4458 Transcript_2916/m.4458 type:complete len:156 (-) Transcript_2916:474-941(-)